MVSRITGSMMNNKMLSNLYMNLGNLSSMQNQLATGRKYAHISDDPSALIYGQSARNKLARLSHYQGAVSSAQKWKMQNEAGVMELQKVVGNVYEELINSGGARTIADRKNIAMNVNQMRAHYLDTLNASYGDRFVFGGYNTPGDYVEGNDPAVKPFTFDNHGNLLFNGFNVSQFDGMPAAFLNVTYVDVGATRYNVSELNPANPDHAAAISALETKWATYIEENMTDADGNSLYAPGLAGLDDFVSQFLDSEGNQIFADKDAMTDNILKMHRLMNDVISFDLGPGVSLPVTHNGLDILFFSTQDINGNPIMRNMYELLNEIHDSINGDVYQTDDMGNFILDDDGNKIPITVLDGDEIHGLTRLIKLAQDAQNHLLVKTAEVGGIDRRLELLEARYEQDEINYNMMRSDAEDADIAEVIMNMKLAETVYQAALSAGARVIQPTLMDFLR